MRRLAPALALSLLAGPALAQDTDLELVLLADSSGSISPAELMFQREGYAQAIANGDATTAPPVTLEDARYVRLPAA